MDVWKKPSYHSVDLKRAIIVIDSINEGGFCQTHACAARQTKRVSKSFNSINFRFIANAAYYVRYHILGWATADSVHIVNSAEYHKSIKVVIIFLHFDCTTEQSKTIITVMDYCKSEIVTPDVWEFRYTRYTSTCMIPTK